jgi:cell division protease FtsH
VTTGAESDLDQVSGIARQLVGRWGMSDVIGPVAVLPPPGQESPLGLDGVAPATKELIDREVRRIVEECYAEALATLTKHRAQLDALAHALLERETLNEDEAYLAAEVSRQTAPAARARGTVPAPVPAGAGRG